MTESIAIIVAVDKNNAIGFENRLLFHIPGDLKRFKALTTGHTVVMGRKTFESLPKGALPNRRNIVLSGQKGISFAGAEVFGSLEEALSKTARNEEVFIIGGASLYHQAMDIASCLHVTEIDATADKADTFFPEIDKERWKEKERETINPEDGRFPFKYSFVCYTKKK